MDRRPTLAGKRDLLSLMTEKGDGMFPKTDYVGVVVKYFVLHGHPLPCGTTQHQDWIG
jgi:hypothetical protein